MNYHEFRRAERAGEADLGHLLSPQFKAVNLTTGRTGIRLEKLFWQLLSELAHKRNVKRADLVRTILAESKGPDTNSASLLRCYVADDQAQELEVLRARPDASDVIALLLAAPVPAFVIDRQKKVHKVNPEFVRMVRATAENGDGSLSADLVQLTLDVPVESLFAKLLRPSDEAQCGYSVQVDARQRRGRAKLVQVVGNPQSVLVGFILS